MNIIARHSQGVKSIVTHTPNFIQPICHAHAKFLTVICHACAIFYAQQSDFPSKRGEGLVAELEEVALVGAPHHSNIAM